MIEDAVHHCRKTCNLCDVSTKDILEQIIHTFSEDFSLDDIISKDKISTEIIINPSEEELRRKLIETQKVCEITEWMLSGNFRINCQKCFINQNCS